ncbi:NAD-dependent epimerase/dehydratase family protein [Rhodospirillales bacterium]|nr:NAD-dependent epimerase/dehydratase family protein [Rhodospirillales bacterium]
MNAQKHVIITGGGGYIGSRLIDILLSRGVYVTSIGRSPAITKSSTYQHFTWQFNIPIPMHAFKTENTWPKIDTFIHLAHVWDIEGNEEDDINLQALKDLLEVSRRTRISRFIFISSVSSRQDAMNRYGRVKFACESLLDSTSEFPVRVGLVYGGTKRNIWRSYLKMAAAPILPMVCVNKIVQPIHIDDLADGLYRLANIKEIKPSLIILGDHKGVTFGQFLKTVATHKFQKRLLIIPLPTNLVRFAISIISQIPFGPNLKHERLDGLVGLPFLNSEASLAQLGLKLRDLNEGLKLQPYEHRKKILIEARTLMASIAGTKKRPYLERCYAKSVMRNKFNSALCLPLWAHAFPSLLGILEPFKQTTLLKERLDLTLKVIEADTDTTTKIYRYNKADNKFIIFGILTSIFLREAMFLPIRIISSALRSK